MTDNPTPEAAMVEVTQADRDRAWPFRGYSCARAPSHEAWDSGVHDDAPLMQAFASHRLAAIQSAHPAGGEGALREALTELESACDGVAATRSPETYLRMIDVDKATPALIRLDEARLNARATLTPQVPA